MKTAVHFLQKHFVITSLCFWLLVLFFPILFGKTFIFGDNFTLLVPKKIYLIQSLKDGILPFWNHYSFSGEPYFADISNAVLYPSTAFFWAFPPGIALSLTILSHFVLSFLGMYLFGKLIFRNRGLALFSSLLWVLSPPFIASINNMAIFQAIAYIPLIFYLLTKAFVIEGKELLLPFFVALQFLAGHPQPLIYTLWCGFFYASFQPTLSVPRKLIILFYLLVLPFLLTALQFIPFVELSYLSTRSIMTTSEVLDGSFHPLHILSFIFPTFFHDIKRGISWGPDWGRIPAISAFIPLPALITFIIWIKKSGKKNYNQSFFVILLFISLVLSFLKHIPLTPWLFDHFSPLKILRSPGNITVMTAFAISALVPLSLSQAIITQKLRQGGLYLSGLVSILCLLSYFLIPWFGPMIYGFLSTLRPMVFSASGFHTLSRDLILIEHLISVFGLTFFGLFIFFLTAKSKPALFFQSVLLLALSTYFSMQNLFFGPNSLYNLTTQSIKFPSTNNRLLPLADYLPYSGLSAYMNNMLIQPPFAKSRYTATEAKEFRELISRRNAMAPNWHLPPQQPSTFGFSTFVLKDTAGYWNNNTADSSINTIPTVPLTDQRISEQGVKYLIADKLVFDGKIPEVATDFPVVFETESWAILENPAAQPVIKRADGTIDQVAFEPNSIHFRTQAQQAGSVTLAMPAYPGWLCHSDFGECQIEPVKPLLQSIKVPSGTHAVALTFKPRFWNQLVAVTALSWLIYLYLFLRLGKSK